MTVRTARLLLPALLALAPAAVAQPVPADRPAVVRTPLQDIDFPGPDKHSLLARTEVAPGAAIPKHTHAGIEVTYVLSGHLRLSIAGRPDQDLGPGGSFVIPAGVVHGGAALGSEPLVLITTYIVEKTAPLATPAP